jgi:hypothetical protein
MPLTTLSIVKAYLNSHMQINALGEVANVETELEECTTLFEITTFVKKLAPISIGKPELTSKYQHFEYPRDTCIAAEIYLKELRDDIYPNTTHLVMCKIDTGGFHTYQPQFKKNGANVFPLLQVTLKVLNHPAKTVWINPNGNESSISASTLRYLSKRKVVETAIAQGVDLDAADLALFEYLDSCGLMPSSVHNGNMVHLVCASADMYRAFLGVQLPNTSNFFSPKILDITPLNAALEIMGLYAGMCYARYEEDPVKYVEMLEAFTVNHSRLLR